MRASTSPTTAFSCASPDNSVCECDGNQPCLWTRLCQSQHFLPSGAHAVFGARGEDLSASHSPGGNSGTSRRIFLAHSPVALRALREFLTHEPRVRVEGSKRRWLSPRVSRGGWRAAHEFRSHPFTRSRTPSTDSTATRRKMSFDALRFALPERGTRESSRPAR
jgi:hypothetical protein